MKMENTTKQHISQSPSDFGIIPLPHHTDERGTLCVADGSDQVFPFKVKRAFWIYDVPADQTRGQHAHHSCAEVVIPLCGSFVAHVNDGTRTIDFVMNNRNEGLYIPPMVWCSFSDFSTDCVCLCLTSDEYDKEGYINDLKLYLNEIQK